MHPHEPSARDRRFASILCQRSTIEFCKSSLLRSHTIDSQTKFSELRQYARGSEIRINVKLGFDETRPLFARVNLITQMSNWHYVIPY
jgi:hypothetical protein